MKQLIKSATVYKADFGMDAAALRENLAAHQFHECLPTQIRSIGFIQPSEGDSMVAEFSGGFAFRVRIDQKQIPAAVVQRLVDEKAAQIQQETGRKPGKKFRAEIKDEVMLDLAKQAFPRTAAVTCFYQQTTGYLIIPTTSQKLADLIITALVKAAGSVKTETINVSNVKHGLTERLRRWNDGDEYAFGVFYPCAEAALKQDVRKITITMGSLQAAHSGINEALKSAFEVTSMGFTHQGETQFRLTHDFKFKRIEFAHTDTEDDEMPSFYAQATLEVDAVSALITAMIDMIGHGKEDGVAEEGGAA